MRRAQRLAVAREPAPSASERSSRWYMRLRDASTRSTHRNRLGELAQLGEWGDARPELHAVGDAVAELLHLTGHRAGEARIHRRLQRGHPSREMLGGEAGH